MLLFSVVNYAGLTENDSSGSENLCLAKIWIDKIKNKSQITEEDECKLQQNIYCIFSDN